MIGPKNIRSDGILTFVQSKTGGRAYVPWSNPLPEFAEGWEDEREVAKQAITGTGETFLAVASKSPSVKGLGDLIADAARATGLKDRSAHGLRKARLTEIAQAGGTSHAIMGWGGHTSLSEVEHYTKAAQMRRLVGRERGRNLVSPG
ncbi:tyrosine-type recombinase/integrase [Paracoccus beibuensis]|uniref:tyrosine-type recombinase/integrase n=1 Tax=Paracoccus beibuensis TaxID=547602 RepID=UPI00223FACE3|nr:tyrosine-type recombinase/integrase [Paracoccus beibuensis]